MPEIANDPFPRMWERVRRTLGLDYTAPRGAIDNLRYSFGIVSAFRGGISRIMNLSNTAK